MGSLETRVQSQHRCLSTVSLHFHIWDVLTYGLSPRLIIPAKQLLPLTLQPGHTGCPMPERRGSPRSSSVSAVATESLWELLLLPKASSHTENPVRLWICRDAQPNKDALIKLLFPENQDINNWIQLLEVSLTCVLGLCCIWQILNKKCVYLLWQTSETVRGHLKIMSGRKFSKG